MRPASCQWLIFQNTPIGFDFFIAVTLNNPLSRRGVIDDALGWLGLDKSSPYCLTNADKKLVETDCFFELNINKV
jgi:hypothetical protein